jgi:hypothetical protein
MTPQQLANFNAMIGYGDSNGAIPGSEVAAGGRLLPAGVSGVTGAISNLSSFNPAATNNMGNTVAGANQYASGPNIPAQVQAAMQAANQEATDVTLPALNQNAALTGNINGSRISLGEGLVQRGLAQQAGNLAAQLGAGAYNTSAALTANQNQANNTALLDAMISSGNLGSGATSLGLGSNAASIGNQGQLFDIAGLGGSGLQQAKQLQDTNQNQMYQFGQETPFEALDNYMGLVSGNYGGTTTGNFTQTTQMQPSMFSTIGSIMGMMCSLFGGGGGFL